MNIWAVMWIAIVAITAIAAGLPIYFNYRLKMAALMAPKSGTPDPKLLARIEVLEKTCAHLQEQVNAAHMLIHDEQRQLDRKLLEKIEAK